MIGFTKRSDQKAIDETAAAWVFRRSGGLDPAEDAEFDAWRAADPRHAAAVTRLERSWSALDRPRLSGHAQMAVEKLRVRALRRRRRRLAMAGAACLLFGVGALSWRVAAPLPVAPEARAIVLLPESRTLPDGSVVELKAGAELEVAFDDQVRRVVLLRGEAHFAVAHREVPFVVSASGVDFRAVGTAFFVQLADRRVELVVTDGRVSVETAGGESVNTGGAAALEPVMVAAGSGVVVPLAEAGQASGTPPVALSQSEMAERLAWRVARLEFTDTPLSEAVSLMNSHNRVRLEIADPDLGRIPVSGLFRADRIEAFVRLLEVNFEVTAEESSETIRLRRKR